MLKTFNSYYAQAVPYINQAESFTEIPNENVLPMSVAAYMSCVKDLALSAVKADLRFLIMDKTSFQIENPPKLYVERIKMAEVRDHGEEANEFDSAPAEQKQASASDFIFTLASEQIKEMDLSLLRPRKPGGTVPHVAFVTVLKGEHVQGDGGPYRQLFQDISAELQPDKEHRERGSEHLLGLL